MHTQTRRIEQLEETSAVGDVAADIHAARYRERFIAAVEEGLADVEAGRVIDDDALTRELDEEFGTLS